MGSNKLFALLMAAILAAAAGARATELTGPHNNQLDGYDALSGAYDVPADIGATPSATFNENENDGLYADGAGTSITVEGGQFEENFTSGIEAGRGATITITGGVFDDNGDEAVFIDYPSVATITGGQFLNNGYGLDANAGGAITLYGGQFGGSKLTDFVSLGNLFPNGQFRQSTIDIYGAFAGLAAGQTATLPYENSGSFFGQLENNSAAQTYTYFGAGITLHAITTLPEPATMEFIWLASAGLLPWRCRRGCLRLSELSGRQSISS